MGAVGTANATSNSQAFTEPVHNLSRGFFFKIMEMRHTLQSPGWLPHYVEFDRARIFETTGIWRLSPELTERFRWLRTIYSAHDGSLRDKLRRLTGKRPNFLCHSGWWESNHLCWTVQASLFCVWTVAFDTLLVIIWTWNKLETLYSCGISLSMPLQIHDKTVWLHVACNRFKQQ